MGIEPLLHLMCKKKANKGKATLRIGYIGQTSSVESLLEWS